VLATIVLLADLAVERFSPQTTLPSSGGSRTATRFRIALVVAVLLILKVLFHVSDTFNYAGFGFWLGIVLTIAIVGITFRLNQGRAIVRGAGSV
jgi:hypothetical protein